MENTESIEFWAEDKMFAMREANKEYDPKTKKVLLGYVNFCDTEIGRILRAKRAHRLFRRLIVIVVVFAVLIGGCHTIDGVGRDLSAWSSPYIEHQER